MTDDTQVIRRGSPAEALDVLEKIRTQQGWNYSQMARFIGVTYTTYSRWRSGESRPEIVLIVQWAGACNAVSSDQVEGDEGAA